MYQFNRKEYEERMKWYQDARFGMFIHWGLYSIPARGEWVRSTEEMPEEEYLPFMKEFDARDYNPKQWAKEAKAAGMKYVVLTAKHHDGFCLFDSKYTDYKVTNTPAGRDLIKEYVEALREEGLKVGLYFTLLDWHHPDYPHYGDRIHPMRNHPECSNENRDFSRYIEYMYNQVEEVCTNYGKIDIMWFDFSYDDMRGEKWGATRLIDMVRRLQPGIIIDNRLEVSGEGRGSLYECDPTPYHGDFISPEQIIPPEGICDKEGNPMVWEACFTMNNNWGYCANDHYYKPASMLIKKLVECVSKGGNMILNVGPDAKGKFPKESSAILAEIGRWMDKNHDSIYGCAPAADIPKPDYGRITRNGNKYYVHIYENTLGPLPLIGFDKNKIVKVRALDDGHEVPISTLWVHGDYPDIAFVDLGPDPVLPDPVDYVLEVEMAEESYRIQKSCRMAAFLYSLTELRCRCLPGSASVSLVYEIIQNPTAYDNNKCNSNNTFRCFLRHLAFGTDGIGIESQGIIDLMRGTHGGSVCDYRHALIHNGNRDLEFRIRSLLIDREIFFTVNDHVVIIRTAPLDIGSYFAVFHSDQSR